LIPAHPISSAQQHSPAQEAFRPKRPSRPSPSSSQAGLSRHPGRAPPHTTILTSPPPSFLVRGRRADHLASPTNSPPLPTASLFSFNGEMTGIDATTTGRRPTRRLPPRSNKRGAHPYRSSPPTPPLSIPLCLAQSTTLAEPHRPSPPLSIRHTQFLHQNQVLIICITQDQLLHTYGQKCSQITKCHE
jgi:hypothetical protein